MTNEKRCAIYNRYSVNAPEMLETKRGKLVTYCENNLGIADHEFFEEVGSVLEKREVFDDMVSRIENGEFSDLLVCNIDRLYKPSYDISKFIEIVGAISEKVDIHIVSHEQTSK